MVPHFEMGGNHRFPEVIFIRRSRWHELGRLQVLDGSRGRSWRLSQPSSSANFFLVMSFAELQKVIRVAPHPRVRGRDAGVEEVALDVRVLRIAYWSAGMSHCN
jgi:hypothetical protein